MSEEDRSSRKAAYRNSKGADSPAEDSAAGTTAVESRWTISITYADVFGAFRYQRPGHLTYHEAIHDIFSSPHHRLRLVVFGACWVAMVKRTGGAA